MARAQSDAAALGLTIMQPVNEAEPGIWEEHLPAWAAWCAVSGQWRTVGLSTMESARILWIGLDYGAAHAGLSFAGITVSPELWDNLRAIEAGAIEELNRVR